MKICGTNPSTTRYRFIDTPIFVSEDTADSYQVFTGNGCPRSNSAMVNDYVQYLRAQLAGSLTEQIIVNGKPANGLFAPACLRHCMEWVEKTADINGRTHAQAFGDWYFGRGGSSTSLNNSTDPATLLACSDVASHD